MSDQGQGPGWWQASDGKWYPPQPEAPPPTPPPAPSATRKRRTGLIIAAAVVLVLLVAGAVILASGSDDAVDDIDTSAFEADTFDDAAALVDEMTEQGVACEDFQDVEPAPGVLGLNEASSAGQCTVDDIVVVVETYPSAGEGEENLDALTDLADCDVGGEPTDGVPDYVSGGNWLVGVQASFGEDPAHGEVIEDVGEALFGDTSDLGCDS